MSTFKTGDRVRVYGAFRDGLLNPFTAVVIHIFSDLTMKLDRCVDKEPFYVHPKQCRKLKPRKELRVIWVNEYPEGIVGGMVGIIGGMVFQSRERAEMDTKRMGAVRQVRFREWPEDKE